MLRPWDLRITLDREAAQPAYLQIAHAIMDGIKRGRLVPGSALPGTRELAEMVGVNRKTVQQAYEELLAQGWLTAEQKRGTFVSAALPVVVEIQAAQPSTPGAAGFSLRRAAPNLPYTKAKRGALVFDDGAPDTRLMPAPLVARAWRRALLEASRRNLLGYGDPRGLLTLREAVADMLNTDRGLNVTAENICITRGSQMAIYLASRLLVQNGDHAAIESLSYPPAREAFWSAGARIIAVGLDEHGMCLDDLEAACQRQPIRAVYVTPHHQFPTTVTMPPDRRIRLLALAEEHKFVIVEDDYDHEFHFAHRPVLPMASAQNWERLLYIGSLSKLLSPSLRVGYLVGAADVITRAGAEIMMIDRQGDPATEAAAAELMRDGVLKSHTRKVLRLYEERRHCLAEALKSALGLKAAFAVPQGGLALWVNFAAGVALLPAALAAQRIGITPGQAFATNGHVTNGARLGFGSMNEAELREAVSRLARALG
jgi:GntR family transcriptional regulator / MocR family aminotransferase